MSSDANYLTDVASTNNGLCNVYEGANTNDAFPFSFHLQLAETFDYWLEYESITSMIHNTGEPTPDCQNIAPENLQNAEGCMYFFNKESDPNYDPSLPNTLTVKVNQGLSSNSPDSPYLNNAEFVFNYYSAIPTSGTFAFDISTSGGSGSISGSWDLSCAYLPNGTCANVPVPEPATFVLLAMGLISFFIFRGKSYRKWLRNKMG